jgi:hypothetical protein
MSILNPLRRSLPASLLGLCLLSASPARAEIPPLSAKQQAAVNAAIDDGVKYLKSVRTPSGTWDDPRGVYPVGYAALPALTLLECGIPAKDAAIVKPATFVRRRVSQLDRTYELALAILLLDRIGDEKDRDLIRTCAVRLVAGQAASGGWGYRCPPYNAHAQKEVLDLLEAIKDVPPEANLPKEVVIPAHLKKLTVFRDPAPIPAEDPRRKNFDAKDPTTDNSNTQFAILALWRAQKYDVPLARTLTRVVRRFQASQNTDGSWGYWHAIGGDMERPSMDCVGLLGLAIGHGLDRPKPTGPAEKPVLDPRIVNGFAALSRHIGGDVPSGPYGVNYYFMWSVERVGVLYNLATIADRDWYRWGSSVLLANQGPLGAFEGGGYPGSNRLMNTCFALLFLKRANLVADLTEKLPFQARELTTSIAKKAATLPPPSAGRARIPAGPEDKPDKR